MGTPFVDIVAKEIAPKDVFGGHGDHLKSDEEPRQADHRIYEDRLFEVPVDIIVVEYEVTVRTQ